MGIGHPINRTRNQYRPVGAPQGMTFGQTEIMKRQMLKSLCQITVKKKKATGFLCNIPYPVLITSNHVLGQDEIKPDEEINIYFTDEKGIRIFKKIKIDETRTTYTIDKFGGGEIDTTIIELRKTEDKLNDQEFLEIDQELTTNEVKSAYETKDVYLIQYYGGEKLFSSIGVIDEVRKINESYILLHNCDASEGSSGSPIILFNHKVIGVHKGWINDLKYFVATFLQYPIKEYLKKYHKKLEQEKDTRNINKITMIYKIKSEQDSIKILGEEFIYNNKGKCMLRINTKEFQLCEHIKYNEFGIKKKDDSLKIILTEVKSETIINMGYMFDECSSLISVDLQSFNTKNVINMQYMFYNCCSLTSVNFSPLNKENVVDIRFMFYNCSSITSINLSSFNTNNVTDMRNMFNNCCKLKSLDFKDFNTIKVTNMASMFLNCSSLTSLDLTSFNTRNVTSMEYIFGNCTSLTMINVTSFNTKNVRRMEGMFLQCSSLKNLDLSSFKTENVINMQNMFNGCKSLTSLDLQTFNTKKVTDMTYMFCNCSSLETIDLFNFNFQIAVDTSCIIDGCKKLNQETIEKFKRFLK